MLRSQDRKWILLGLFVCCCVSGSARAQPRVAQPDQLAGPWEVTGSSSVDGIFVMIYRSSSRQSIQVRVYHRKGGHETGAWHVVNQVEDTAAPRFDGTNLRLRELTATFDSNAKHWTGEWILDGHTHNVVLERPHAAKGSPLNRLCGDWQTLPDTRPRWSSAPSVQIHILQSSDDGLTAWMDIATSILPERLKSETFGRSMKVVSADPKNVVLQNESPKFEVRGVFTGVLSDDGNILSGTWNGRGAESFHRIR